MRYITEVEVEVDIEDMIAHLNENDYSVVDESAQEVYRHTDEDPISWNHYVNSQPSADSRELISEVYTELYSTKDPAARLAYRWVIEKLEGK